MPNVPSDEQLAEMTKALTEARIENWLAFDLFTWQWWFILALFIVPWFVFYYAADRKILPRLWLYGTFLYILISVLDLLGYENGLWTYPYKIAPFGPFVAFFDASPLPVIYMLEYQHFPTWRSFIAIVVLTSMIFSFIFEPILVAMGVYVLLKWRYIYSFPVYILIPILMRLAVEKIFASAQEG